MQSHKQLSMVESLIRQYLICLCLILPVFFRAHHDKLQVLDGKNIS